MKSSVWRMLLAGIGTLLVYWAELAEPDVRGPEGIIVELAEQKG